MGSQYPVWPGWETVRVIGRGGYGAVYEIARCDCNGEPSAKLPDDSPMKAAVGRLMQNLGL